MTVPGDWARRWMIQCAQVMRDHREELNSLDRVIGDGDHGENLARGFSALEQRLEESASDADTSTVLTLAATTLMSTVGGASGPLYGTAFLRAAKAVRSRQLDGDCVIDLLVAACEGIEMRGRAVTGEKTMVDAWESAVKAAQVAALSGADTQQVLVAAAQGACAGADATVAMRASKGRSSYLGERSVGHRDPGAQSTALILKAAAQTATNGEFHDS